MTLLLICNVVLSAFPFFQPIMVHYGLPIELVVTNVNTTRNYRATVLPVILMLKNAVIIIILYSFASFNFFTGIAEH